MFSDAVNARIPDTFLLQQMAACLLSGFIQEAMQNNVFEMRLKSQRNGWGFVRQYIQDTMGRAAGRMAGRYEKEYKPETASLTITTDEYFEVVRTVGRKFADVLKHEDRIWAEHEALALFHELLQPYKTV